MLRTRVLTALALLAVIVPVAWSGSVVAVGLVALIATVAAGWEWSRLLGLDRLSLPIGLLVLGGRYVGMLTSGAMPPMASQLELIVLLVAAAFWLLQAPPAVIRAHVPDWLTGRIVATVAGAVVLLAFLFAVVALYQRGPMTLMSALVIVWLSDISAYFCGRRFGRHKLAPAVSPGKTWEGAIGAAVIVTGLALAWAVVATGADWLTSVARGTSVAALLVAVVAVVALGIIGDLFESLLKRRAGIKDSSALLPGHGGVLDRIDALLPVLPVAELLLRWLA